LKKRVVIYGINYAPEIAGVGRYTGEIGEHLAAEGHEVCVVTAPPHYPGWKAKAPYSAARYAKETLAGAEVYRCPLYLHEEMRGVRRLVAPLSFALSSAPVAFWQILKRRPDVVITVEPTLFTAPLALLAAKLVGAKTVLHVQDLEIEAAFAVGHLGKGGLLAKAAGLYDRLVTRAFDRVITISYRMAEKILEKGVDPTRVEVIRNWVDLDQIKPQETSQAYRAELGLKPSDFVVLYAGNIGAKQGVRLVIEAARELHGRQDIVFAVAGQGPMRPEVEAAAAELSNIRVYDFQPEARFSEFLSLADLHVLPQEREAADLLLPSKLGGMLASGRRIVVTADAGTELARFLDTSCVFTPPGDPLALAGAILEAAAVPPCPDHRAQRLQLACALGKPELIEDFTRAALFLQPALPTAQAAREAA
jgi:colanic acid biosynthesis glycosyl transferase WcaI